MGLDNAMKTRQALELIVTATCTASDITQRMCSCAKVQRLSPNFRSRRFDVFATMVADVCTFFCSNKNFDDPAHAESIASRRQPRLHEIKYIPVNFCLYSFWLVQARQPKHH